MLRGHATKPLLRSVENISISLHLIITKKGLKLSFLGGIFENRPLFFAGILECPKYSKKPRSEGDRTGAGEISTSLPHWDYAIPGRGAAPCVIAGGCTLGWD